MKKLFVILVAAVLLSSCGALNVTVNHDMAYKRSTPITILQSKDDATGTLGELQFLLKSNGYKLMSYTAAKKAFTVDAEAQSNSAHVEFANTTTLNSCYVLEYDYTYTWDVGGYYYGSFYATITDLVSGEMIMSANFRGYKPVRAVLNELITKMNSVIR